MSRRSKRSADVHTNTAPVIWSRVAPKRLTLNRVIALLMIALHICQESTILMSDVLRWIRLLQLPCIDPSDLIPDDQLVNYYQLANSNDAFCISYHEIEWETSVMISFLGISADDCPTLAVFPVIERFVEELNLPSALIPIIAEIASKLDRSTAKLRIFVRTQQEATQRSEGVEGFILCLIIHVLRMLFGLDGLTEYKIATKTRDLQQVQEKFEYFNIGDWISHISYRRLHLFTHTTVMKNRSTSMSVRFVEKNILNERRILKWARLRQNLYADENYKDLQNSLQEVRVSKFSKEICIDVPVSNRPFRAHTESLVDLYPVIGVDYSRTSLEPVLCREVPLLENNMWAKRCLKSIRKAQTEFATTSSFIGARNIRLATQQKLCMNLVSSSVLRWLITVCAEMIEQEPLTLLGQLVAIEPLFHASYTR